MTDAGRFERWDARFDRWSERLNPIVVKETRQALSSREFPLAFLSMLIMLWITTVSLIGLRGEELYYAEAGPDFFMWYLVGLLGALCFVVPLRTFRSVVSEFDGQTYEMLAITTLSPRQVVFGKLKSAAVQMGAFYSAAAPFVCFTYMLEGLSIPGIVLALVIAFLAGISSCMGAMMLGALAKQSAWQVLCLLLSIVLGGIVFGIGMSGAVSASVDLGGMSSLGGVCAGFGCFLYVFLFFSLLTIGVSIAQFTPTMPRPGRIESSGPAGLRLNAQRSFARTKASDPDSGAGTTSSGDATPRH